MMMFISSLFLLASATGDPVQSRDAAPTIIEAPSATPQSLPAISNTLRMVSTDIYVWTDSKGVRHYSDQPSKVPPSATRKTMTTPTPILPDPAVNEAETSSPPPAPPKNLPPLPSEG